jgi:hypothetical protein
MNTNISIRECSYCCSGKYRSFENKSHFRVRTFPVLPKDIKNIKTDGSGDGYNQRIIKVW